MSEHVEVRIDPTITDKDAINDPEVALDLHDWPDGIPSLDRPITVAIMDSGVHEDAFENHPWFENMALDRQVDFTGRGEGGDEVGHGTAVASVYGKGAADVIAGATSRSNPIQIIDVRIFGSEGRTTWEVIRKAYEWMVENADTIDLVNMSWGSIRDVPAINELHEKLLDAGVHDVVAAGNSPDHNGSPATAERAFAAGAVDSEGQPTRWTSSSESYDNPDVAALGKTVKLARAPGTSMGHVIDEDFVAASGTSFSAPWTGAGYCLCYAMRRGPWNNKLEKAAPDIPGTSADGEGLLKVSDAMYPAGDAMEAHMWNFEGKDTLYLDGDVLPEGESTAEVLQETGSFVDIRINKP